MLQRQIMFKQLQELQRQQQLQQVGDTRQQSYMNQLSLQNRQTSGSQFPQPINGRPVNDPSEMYLARAMNLTQHGVTPIGQGFPNGLDFSQAQSQTVHSRGAPAQHIDSSFYRNPFALAGNNVNQYIHSQQAFHDSVNMFNKGSSNNQAGTTVLQPSGFGNSMINEQFNAPASHVGMSDGAFAINQDSSRRGGQSALVSLFPEKATETGSSQVTDSLDPLEQKILFNTDDNNWGSSLGWPSNGGTGGFCSSKEILDHPGSYPSIQSGSWSALMQSAVAEASTSDSGPQEEWSGLSFQTPELSTDNQPSSYVDSGRQQNTLVGSNLESISSPSSKPELMLHGFKTSVGFSDLQQSGYQFLEHREALQSSRGSIQQYPNNGGKWVDISFRGDQSIPENQLVQRSFSFQNVWPGQQYEHPQSNACQLAGNLFSVNEQPSNNQTGNSSDLFSRLDSVKSDKFDAAVSNKTSPQLNDFSAVSGPYTNSSNQGFNFESKSNADTSAKFPRNGSMREAGETSGRPESCIDKDSLGTLVAHSYNDSSAVQSFDLGLGQPSQQKPKEYSACESQQMGNSVIMSPFDLGYANNQLQNQYGPAATIANQSAKCLSFDSATPHNLSFPVHTTAQCQTSPIPESKLVNHPPMLPDMSQQAPNMSLNVLQQGFHLRPNNTDTNLLQISTSNQGNSLKELTAPSGKSLSFDCKEEKSGKEISHHPTESEMCGKLLNRFTHGQESPGNHLSEVNGAEHGNKQSSAVSARDLEEFGQSLRAADSLRQNYMKNMESDSFKRTSVVHSGVDAGMIQLSTNDFRQQISYGSNLGVMTSSASDPNASPDSRHQTERTSRALHQDVQDKVISGQGSISSNIAQQPQISLQMAQSWFKHYEQLKNGQTLSRFDAEAPRSSPQQISIACSDNLLMVDSAFGASKGSSLLPNTSTVLAVDVPLHVLHSDFGDPCISALRPKKRKMSAFDLLPWHVEVTQCSHKLQKISNPALEWAIASNRKAEKMDDEAQLVEDVRLSSRAKRRLISVTELMQQVFRPPPAFILSADASSSFDSTTYSAARLALASACNLVSDQRMPIGTDDVPLQKLKVSKTVGRQDFTEIAEGLIDRAKRIETESLGLNRKASVSDVKAELLELEKFCVMNCLAKFHSKGHVVAADESASGSTSAPAKINPQRYVVALPMPRTVPEGVTCLSL